MGSDKKSGVVVSYEAIRKWCRKFDQAYANQLRRCRPRPGDTWHLVEAFLTINKQRHYLWRAVNQEGDVLDILVQRRRDKAVAKKFFCKLLKGCSYVPRVIITDRRHSYGAAKREILPGVEHRQHRYLNNRAENAQAHSAAGAAHTAVPCGVWSHCPTLPPAPPLASCLRVPPRDGATLPGLARRYRDCSSIRG